MVSVRWTRLWAITYCYVVYFTVERTDLEPAVANVTDDVSIDISSTVGALTEKYIYITFDTKLWRIGRDTISLIVELISSQTRRTDFDRFLKVFNIKCVVISFFLIYGILSSYSDWNTESKTRYDNFIKLLKLRELTFFFV